MAKPPTERASMSEADQFAVLIFFFITGMIFEIPGLLRRGFFITSLSMITVITLPIVVAQYPLTIPNPVFYSIEGGLLVASLILRFWNRCPQCNKPLAMPIRGALSHNPFTGYKTHSVYRIECRWCKYARSSTSGFDMDLVKQDRRFYEDAQEWHKCLVVIILQNEGLERDFIEWWQTKKEYSTQKLEVPTDSFEQNKIAIQFIKEQAANGRLSTQQLKTLEPFLK